MNVAEIAIERNDMVGLLEGKSCYHLDNNQWVSVNVPIDWTRVIPMIYKVYENNQDIGLPEKYEKAINTMLHGTADEVYCAMAVVYFQILREETDRAPFKINRKEILEELSIALEKNQHELEHIKKWGGYGQEKGLWNEIERYKNLLQKNLIFRYKAVRKSYKNNFI